MVGRGDPPPRAAFEGPDIAAQAHAVQLQLMAMASRPAASHGVHGAPGRGSILGLGGGGRGSARGTGRQGRGRGRAQGDNAGQGNGPPLGSGRAGDAAGQGDGGQHDVDGDPSQSFRPPRPTTTNQTKKKETEGDGGQHDTGGDPSQLFCPPHPTSTNQTKKKGTEIVLDLNDLLVASYGLKPSMHMSTYEMLAIFLFICGGNESNRRTQNRFKHSGETISRKFNEVLDSLMAMAHDFIRPKDPNFRAIHKRIRDDRRAYPHFKDCIGALDGTHIRVSLSPEQQVRYIGKTGIPTQNVLAVCDFDMCFTYVATGQPGAMHDTSVLYNAVSVDKEFFPHPPRGKYYVVDAGYPNHPGYLAPYKGERYHLPKWHRGMEPQTPMEKFNRVHSSIRNIIERSFGLLKMKWHILYKMSSYPMHKQKMIVVATMVLRNFIREHGGEDPDFARFDREPNFVPTIPEWFNKYAVPPWASDGSTFYRNARSIDEFCDVIATDLASSWR